MSSVDDNHTLKYMPMTVFFYNEQPKISSSTIDYEIILWKWSVAISCSKELLKFDILSGQYLHNA